MKTIRISAATLFASTLALLVGCEGAHQPTGSPDLPSFDVHGEGDETTPGLDSCAPAATVTCGSQVEGDTTDPNSGYTDAIDGYPVAVGNYSGPEVTYAFRAMQSGEVTWSLVDPDPTSVNFDLFVLDGSLGSCLPTQALSRGFNDVSFDAVAGVTYFLVLDGYDGDVGPFEARVDCADSEDAGDLADDSPDLATYGECLFGWFSRDIEVAPHLQSQLQGQYATVESVPELLGAQMVEGITQEGWADVSNVRDAFEYVDDDGVYEYSVVLTTTGERFTWIKWYVGDTEVGYIFREGTFDLVAIVGDGDVHDCTVGLQP